MQAILERRTETTLVVEEVVQVPAAIYDWKATESGREQAIALQLQNREKFLKAFSKGLAVLGFVRDAEGNGSFELGHLSQLRLN